MFCGDGATVACTVVYTSTRLTDTAFVGHLAHDPAFPDATPVGALPPYLPSLAQTPASSLWLDLCVLSQHSLSRPPVPVSPRVCHSVSRSRSRRLISSRPRPWRSRECSTSTLSVSSTPCPSCLLVYIIGGVSLLWPWLWLHGDHCGVM